MLTRQEFFDRSVAHLRKQGSSARHMNGHCAYLTKYGKKCAIGCMIADEDYEPGMEGRSVIAVVRAYDRVIPLRRTSRNILFLQALQKAHDDAIPTSSWMRHVEDNLRKVAKAFNLDYKPVDSGSPAGA